MTGNARVYGFKGQEKLYQKLYKADDKIGVDRNDKSGQTQISPPVGLSGSL